MKPDETYNMERVKMTTIDLYVAYIKGKPLKILENRVFSSSEEAIKHFPQPNVNVVFLSTYIDELTDEVYDDGWKDAEDEHR